MDESADDDDDDDADVIDVDRGRRVPANQSSSCCVESAAASLGCQGDGSDSPLLGDDVVWEAELIGATPRQPSAEGDRRPLWRQNYAARASI